MSVAKTVRNEISTRNVQKDMDTILMIGSVQMGGEAMKIEPGMRCRFREAYTGEMCNNGVVISVESDGSFTVCEDLDIPPQYNDSFTDFSPDDIGKSVFFEEVKE